jgi:AcrR family transcriptional regulator
VAAPSRKKPLKTPRPRRTAEEAQRLILDAAEKRLQTVGPAGIRLQDVAADVGVSHPTILHHFGSRELLVEAVVKRALAVLQADIVKAWEKESFEPPDAAALLRRVEATLGDEGHARLVVWLALEGRRTPDPVQIVSVLAGVMHDRRLRETQRDAPREDTTFLVMLVTLALVAEAIVGPAVRESAGLGDDPTAKKRFHEWMAGLITRHMHEGTAS